MRYQPLPGESLHDIASRLTLSPAYADAIAAQNGIYADVTGNGETLPYPTTSPIAWFGELTIPDSWLKPGATPASDSGFNSTILIAVLAVVILLSDQSKGKR